MSNTVAGNLHDLSFLHCQSHHISLQLQERTRSPPDLHRHHRAHLQLPHWRFSPQAPDLAPTDRRSKVLSFISSHVNFIDTQPQDALLHNSLELFSTRELQRSPCYLCTETADSFGKSDISNSLPSSAATASAAACRPLSTTPAPKAAGSTFVKATIALSLVGVTSYLFGSLYPPQMLKLLLKPAAPPRLRNEGPEAEAHTRDVEDALHSLPFVKQLKSVSVAHGSAAELEVLRSQGKHITDIDPPPPSKSPAVALLVPISPPPVHPLKAELPTLTNTS